jgi:hypothetical protein
MPRPRSVMRKLGAGIAGSSDLAHPGFEAPQHDS